MISKSGAGPAPMPGKTVTAKQFASAFEFVHDPKTQAAAAKISADFEHEKGCEVAVRSFHAHLPLNKMRSDLDSSFGACFFLRDYDLQISRPVAQVLVAAGMIQESELSPHPVYAWHTLMHADHFVALTHGFKRAVSKIADSVHRLKRSRSTSNTDRNRSRTVENVTKHESASIGPPFKRGLPLYGEIQNKTEDEQSESSTSENQVKHSVRYALITMVEKPSTNDNLQNTSAAASSPAINPPRKNIKKPQPNNKTTTIRRSSSQKPQTTKTKQRSTGIKDKNTSLTSISSNNKSPEQKAADMSGLSIDVCKKILAEFQKIKRDRHPSNSTHRIHIPHGFHRSRSRSNAAD